MKTITLDTLRAGALALIVALVAGLALGCATMTDTDRAALHNAHVGAVILRPRVYRAFAEDAPDSYERCWDGITGTLGRLDLRFNGPEIATSTALMKVPTE